MQILTRYKIEVGGRKSSTGAAEKRAANHQQRCETQLRKDRLLCKGQTRNHDSGGEKNLAWSLGEMTGD